MISSELQELIYKYKELGMMRLCKGATKEQISTFEKNHAVSLPNKYKEWLEYSDGGDLFLPAGIQLYGVAEKPTINVDDEDRPNKNYIVIGTLSTGDPILCEKSGEQIEIYNHEAARIESDEIYPDFYAFLSDLVDILGIGG